MSNTKHTPEALVRFLVSLSEEHILFLRMHATMINNNGEYWYHLPNYYRHEKENIFEVMPPDQVPKEIKSFQHSENQYLLEALKDVAELWEEGLPLDLTTYNKVKNAIKQAENNE